MTMKPSALFLSVLLCLFSLNGCGNDLTTARGVVEEFIDQNYVRIDLHEARKYVVGLALEKMNEQIRLTAGHTIDASTRKPRVNYELLEKKEGENRASFLYLGTIRMDDGYEFTRRWIISARKEDQGWRVSNFTESD